MIRKDPLLFITFPVNAFPFVVEGIARSSKTRQGYVFSLFSQIDLRANPSKTANGLVEHYEGTCI